MLKELLMMFAFTFFVLFIPIFLFVFFMPAIFVYLHPWICSRSIKDFEYPAGLRWYVNWIYRVSHYRCKVPRDYFNRVWFIYSLFATLIVAYFPLLIVLGRTWIVCLVFAIPLLIVGYITLYRWVDHSLKRKYLLSGDK